MNLPNKTLDELNDLLDVAAIEYKNNRRKFLCDKVKKLQLAIENSPLPIVSIIDVIDKNIEDLLPSDNNEIKSKIRELINRADEIIAKKKESISRGDYEIAARLRDEEKQIPLALVHEIMKVNGFNQGFNLFNGSVLVITAGDSDKDQVLNIVLNRVDKRLNLL